MKFDKTELALAVTAEILYAIDEVEKVNAISILMETRQEVTKFVDGIDKQLGDLSGYVD